MLFAVGNYTAWGGPGLAMIRAEEGSLELLSATETLDDPIWVIQSAADPRIFYASGTVPGGTHGMVANYLWDGNDFMILSDQPSGGSDCCHLALNADESHLYAVNYAEGTIAVFPLHGGRIGPRIQLISYDGPLGPSKERQEHAHLHQLVFRPGTAEAFVCSLGSDQVLRYDRQADGTLILRDTVAVEPGSGPRHLLFDGPNRFYLVGELSSSVFVYTLQNSVWQCAQALSTLPEGFSGENTAAAIRMDGQRVYVSNRGHDSIARFDRLPDGTLRAAGHVALPGRMPRDFVCWEGGFLAALQKDGGVARTDAHGALLSSADVPGAVCLCPVKE